MLQLAHTLFFKLKDLTFHLGYENESVRRLFVTPWAIAHQAPLDFPSNTVVGCYSRLQVFFPTQGSNPGPLHYRQILYHLSYQGSSLKHSRQTEAAEQAYEEAEAALPSWYVEKEADV